MVGFKQIATSHLQVGMYVAEQGNEAWIPETNTKRGGPIFNDRVIEQIRLTGVSHIVIDTNKGHDSAYAVPLYSPLIAEQRRARVPLDHEYDAAQAINDSAMSLVEDTLISVKAGNAIDGSQVDSVSANMLASIHRNQNALICLGQIRCKDSYLLKHSCNVGMLLGVLGRSMGFDDGTVQDLITGGMLHDIGKVRVDDGILHKPGKLTAEEWQEMKNHVIYGVEVLERSENISPIAKAICAQHHERIDGSGYPYGLSNEEISMYGRMASVVDVYDAISADRCYHEGLPSPVAMKRLREWAGDHLDKDLVYQFIKAMGVYPVGSLVLLSDQTVGVVIEDNPLHPNLPVVRVMYHARRREYMQVKEVALDSKKVDCVIEKPVDPQLFNINIIDFL